MPLPRVNLQQRDANNHNITTAITPIVPSIKNAGSNGIGFIKPVTPNTNNMFIMFEPTMFPTAKSERFFSAATTHVTNSGKLVPNAMIVKPIMRSDMFNARAIFTDESTIKLLLKITAAMPTIKNKIIFIPDIFCVFSSGLISCLAQNIK